MLSRKQKGPELLPGADQEEDCQPVIPDESEIVDGNGDDHDDDHDHDVTWGSLGSGEQTAVSAIESWLPRRARWAHWLERISLWMERPFNRIASTKQLNPLYHTGMISTFLLIVVGLTGFYIFLFYQYGFEASYESVATRIEGPFIARIMRAIHRYASGALVITTLLHAYRTLFMERFRGPRWLAWVTGIFLTIIIWLAGVTGYWLIWDQRAQLINDGFIRFLDSFSNMGTQLAAWMARAEQTGESWPLLLALLGVHVLLFLIAAGFFVLHIRRLKRAQFLPELHWTVAIGAILLIISALFPLGMLPPADPTQVPASIRLDPIFLFYLPAVGRSWSLWLWGGLLLATAVSLALPWLPRARRVATAPDNAADGPAVPLLPAQPPTVNIIKERCTGCTKCALDCPFGAIEMVERHDGKPHKFIAIEDPGLCVSCGICVGSCDGVAVTMGDLPPELMWASIATRLSLARATVPDEKIKLVFTCERHAAHGAKPYVQQPETAAAAGIEVIALPCVGTAPPDMMVKALASGVSEIQIIGCPPFDCANREGNLWQERRITRKRVPRLKRAYANAPITAVWTTPDEFEAALNTPPVTRTPEEGGEPDYLASRRMFPTLNWRNFVGAFALLALVMVAQILLTDLPFQPAAANGAQVRVLLADPAAPFNRPGAFPRPTGSVELQLTIDGVPIVSQTYTAESLFAPQPVPFFVARPLDPGTRHVQLAFFDPDTDETTVLFENTVDLAAGDILRIQPQFDFNTICKGATCAR